MIRAQLKQVLLTAILFFAFDGISQTKLIAFKSHSGNLTYFTSSVAADDFDMEPHNLGMAPQRLIKTAKLDSLIHLNDTTAIMVTSEVCRNEYEPIEYAQIWNEGRDTVYNHPVWNQSNVDSIKRQLKTDYFFTNSPDSVVFVGFNTPPKLFIDNDGDGEPDQEKIAPLIKPNGPPGMGVPFAVVSISLLAILVWLISWRKMHFKQTEVEGSI